jgi:hypothetical protein
MNVRSLGVLLAATAATFACGKVVTDTFPPVSYDGAAPPDVDDAGVEASALDARPDAPTDISSQDASLDAPEPPDGGPPPVVACGDAADPCLPPPSVCLDEHWMRYYGAGYCSDAGTCEFTGYDMLCPPSPTPPDCYQGGCRIVIVR